MKVIIYAFIFYIVLLFLLSCSPEKRLARLIKNNPSLLVKDTITIIDTTIVKGSTVDSMFVFNSDTIVISDSNQIIKYFYNTTTKNHYIKGEVRDRTIAKEIKVPYEKIIVKELPWYEKYWWVLLLIIAVLIYFKK